MIKKKRKRQKKNLEDTLKLQLRHYQCHQKYLDETHLTTPKNITNNY
jgi:hypothetical protein